MAANNLNCQQAVRLPSTGMAMRLRTVEPVPAAAAAAVVAVVAAAAAAVAVAVAVLGFARVLCRHFERQNPHA